jgi:hypothetical protein
MDYGQPTFQAGSNKFSTGGGKMESPPLKDLCRLFAPASNLVPPEWPLIAVWNFRVEPH